MLPPRLGAAGPGLARLDELWLSATTRLAGHAGHAGAGGDAAPCPLLALVAVLFIREVPLRTTIDHEDEIGVANEPVQVR